MAGIKGKVLLLTGYGGYDKVKLTEEEILIPKNDEIVIHIMSAGVNFADLMLRQGYYDSDIKPQLPCVLGLEGSGVVHSVGGDVTDFKVGDRIICLINTSFRRGTWQEYCLVPANHCIHMPDGIDYNDAAALPVNYIAAYHMVFGFGNLRPNQSVLVHMAAGGLGMAVTQMCRTVDNVTIFGTASASKHEMITQNGVDHSIDYHTQNYVKCIKKISPQGVDLVIDPLCGQDSAKSFDLLKPLGKIIHCGTTNAVTGETKSWWNIAKTWIGMQRYSALDMINQNKGVCGYNLGRMSHCVDEVRRVMQCVLDLYQEGKIKPRIDTVWPFEDVGAAMARIHDRKNIGKVLLTTADASVGASQ